MSCPPGKETAMPCPPGRDTAMPCPPGKETAMPCPYVLPHNPKNQCSKELSETESHHEYSPFPS
jgi:hypothetical protein